MAGKLWVWMFRRKNGLKSSRLSHAENVQPVCPELPAAGAAVCAGAGPGAAAITRPNRAARRMCFGLIAHPYDRKPPADEANAVAAATLSHRLPAATWINADRHPAPVPSDRGCRA